MQPMTIGEARNPKPFREIINESFQRIEEVYAYECGPVSICRLLQRFPDRTKLASSSDHTINISMGGGYAVERYENTRLLEVIKRPSAITVIPAGEQTAWRAPGLVDVVHLYIKPSSLARFLEEDAGVARQYGDLRPAVGQPDPFLRGLAALFGHQAARRSAADRVFSQSLTQLVLSHVVRTYTNAGAIILGSEEYNTAPSASQEIARARDYILEHLSEGVSLDKVAEHAGITPWQLRQAFREETGENPLMVKDDLSDHVDLGAGLEFLFQRRRADQLGIARRQVTPEIENATYGLAGSGAAMRDPTPCRRRASRRGCPYHCDHTPSRPIRPLWRSADYGAAPSRVLACVPQERWQSRGDHGAAARTGKVR